MKKEIKENSELIYEGKIITVRKDQVTCPNGRTAYREVVHHHGGVGILAIKDDKIILVEQYRYVPDQFTLEIPAGKLEKNENPQLCAYRELEEETDYRAKDMNLVCKLLPTPGYDDELLYIYQTKNFEHVNDSLPSDEDEFIKVQMIPIDQAYQMILDQKIIDGKTIIAIMYAYIEKHSA